MEHYRSTLATTALAVFGLVTAAHVLHPGNYEELPRRARPLTAQVETSRSVAWTDPQNTLLPRADVVATEVAALTTHMTMPLPPGATMAPTLPAEMTVTARSQPTGVHRQRKVAQHGNRVRQAALAHEQVPVVEPESAAGSPITKAGSGPLDDLLHGLGLGGDEG